MCNSEAFISIKLHILPTTDSKWLFVQGHFGVLELGLSSRPRLYRVRPQDGPQEMQPPETKQQPSMLPGPAVSGCCFVSFHFLWAILWPHPVLHSSTRTSTFKISIKCMFSWFWGVSKVTTLMLFTILVSK